jgi:hypothetical protein
VIPTALYGTIQLNMTPSTQVYYDGQIFVNQFVTASLVVWAMNRLKQWNKIPYISQNSDKLNHWLSIGISFLSALGINYNYSYASTDNGTFTIVLTGISFWSMWSFGKVWVVSYAMQHYGFRVSSAPDKKDEIITRPDLTQAIAS